MSTNDSDLEGVPGLIDSDAGKIISMSKAQRNLSALVHYVQTHNEPVTIFKSNQPQVYITPISDRSKKKKA